MIHKSSEGADYPDTEFINVIKLAEGNGIMVGAYHFGTHSGANYQVDYFLSRVRSTGARKVLLALDFEPYDDKSKKHNQMLLYQAADFIRILKARTGIVPVLYTNPGYLNECLKRKNEYSKEDLSVLRECPLWVSSFSSEPVLIDSMDSWKIWQYSDRQKSEKLIPACYQNGTNKEYPCTIKGFNGEKYLEMNLFKGSKSTLSQFWEKHSLHQ